MTGAGRVAAARRALAASLGAHPLAWAVGGLGLAAGASWLRLGLERTPALDTCSAPYLGACGLAGLGLLAAGLAALRIAADAAAWPWRRLLAGAAAVHLVAALSLPLTSRDAYYYLAQGAVEAAGQSAYRVPAARVAPAPLLAAVEAKWASDTSPYGPVMHALAGAVALAGRAAGSPVWVPLAAWKALMLLAALGAVTVAWAHLRRSPDPSARGAFALFAFSPLLAWEVSAQAHNEGVLVLAAAAFLSLAARGRTRAALAALLLGTLTKVALAPLLGLGLVLAARRARWRAGTAALALGGAAVAGLAVALAVRAFGSPWQALAPMLVSDPARRSHSLAHVVCFALEWLRGAGPAAAAYALFSRGSALVTAALLAVAAWRARDVPTLARGWAVAALGLFATTPWFQPWYPAWILPVLLVEPDPRWRDLLARYAAASAILWIAPLDPVTTIALHAWTCWRALALLRAPAEGAEVALS